jgi:hypothetical protein
MCEATWMACLKSVAIGDIAGFSAVYWSHEQGHRLPTRWSLVALSASPHHATDARNNDMINQNN